MRAPSVPRANCLEAAMPKRDKLVAIVEDNQPFRESMQKLIALLGYPVEAFPSAASFLASPCVVEVACLVADVHMPGMTGPELHRHLKDAGHKIPTILVTAYPDEIVRDAGFEGWGPLLSLQTSGRRPSRTMPRFGGAIQRALSRTHEASSPPACDSEIDNPTREALLLWLSCARARLEYYCAQDCEAEF